MNAQKFIEKYDFNIYDSVVAWALAEYVSHHENKFDGVVSGTTIDGRKLATILDAAVVWAKETASVEQEQKLQDLIQEALNGFNGRRYVQAMDFGFAEFVSDLLAGKNTS